MDKGINEIPSHQGTYPRSLTSNGQMDNPAEEPARKGLEVSLLTQERVLAHKWPAGPKGKESCHVRALGYRVG